MLCLWRPKQKSAFWNSKLSLQCHSVHRQVTHAVTPDDAYGRILDHVYMFVSSYVNHILQQLHQSFPRRMFGYQQALQGTYTACCINGICFPPEELQKALNFKALRASQFLKELDLGRG